MILVFGMSSLTYASSSSSSSIAQRLVQAAAGQAASTGQQRVAAPSANNKAQQEDAHNPASAQSSSAGAIPEAHLHAIWANLLSSSNNYAQAPLPSTDGLSSASATASTALVAGYATQHPARSEMFSASQGLGVSLPSSSSSSNSSSSGSAQPAQASAPDKKTRAKRIQPDAKRFASYNEEEAREQYKKCEKEGKRRA